MTYKITGTWTSENSTHTVSRPLADYYIHSESYPNMSPLDYGIGASGAERNGVVYHGRAEIQATVETTLRWTGPAGTAPAEQAIRLSGKSLAETTEYSGQMNVNNGIRTAPVATSAPEPRPPGATYVKTLQALGNRYRKVKVGSDGTIKLTTNISSFSKAVGGVRVRVEFSVAPVEFGVGIASDRDETVGRKAGTNDQNEPAGFPVKNGFQGDGRYVGDTVMAYDGLVDPDVDLTGFYQGAFHAVESSMGVPSLFWSASGLSIAGSTVGPTIQTDKYDLPPTVTREGTISLTMVDSLSGLDETAEYVMRIHAALEKETMIGATESGRLDWSSHQSVRGKFAPINFGTPIYNNAPTEYPFESTVTTSESREEGWQGSLNGNAQFPIKVVNLTFGGSVTKETKTVTKLDVESKKTIRVAPYSSFQRRVVMTGTVNKWLCSSWSRHGWSGDSQHLVVSNLVMAEELLQLPLNSGGQ